MENLGLTKPREIAVPDVVARYSVIYYLKHSGWRGFALFHTTPESAVEHFMKFYEDKLKDIKPMYYKVYEVYLDVLPDMDEDIKEID